MEYNNSNTGLLINSDTKLHRKWFIEMVNLLGIKALYRSPVHTEDYTLQGEMKPLTYSEEVPVGVIFEEHIDQKTAKKLGWNAELMTDSALIHVPYDLDGLQVGGLFKIPSGYDNTCFRLFRVVELSAIMVYPASITCRIVPEYADTAQRSEIEEFNFSNFNLLNEGN